MARERSRVPFLACTLLLLLLSSTATAHKHRKHHGGRRWSPFGLGIDGFIKARSWDFLHRLSEIGKGVQVSLDQELSIAERVPRVITVSKDGRGDFATVADAVMSVPPGNARRTVIKILPGVYREKVVVDRSRPFVTFYGADPLDMPVITFDGTAAVYGTWESATVAVESHYFVACNVVFENSSPKPVIGRTGTQAVALRISGDKAAFYNCRFYGHQDTLCDDKGMHYFKDCHIRGTEDFIFGNARSIYSHCTIESVSTEPGTALTAQARSKIEDKSGFSFIFCNITGTGSAYLSRAWRSSSRVVFAYTYMGSVVHPRGWDDKGVVSNDKTVYYAEYKCRGPGASTGGRVGYGRVLNDHQVRPFLSMTFIHAATWLLPAPVL